MMKKKKMTLTDLNKQMAEIKKQATVVLTQSLLDKFLKIQKKCPELKSVSWRQYTPYFNDGDTCYFGVYAGSDVEINGKDSYEYGDGDPVATAGEEFGSFVDEIAQEFLLDAFGDHQTVTVSAEGITSEDYEHD
jgi:hypothetical protein